MEGRQLLIQWLFGLLASQTVAHPFSSNFLATPGPDLACVTMHCGLQMARCLADSTCRAAMICNARCQGKRNEQACNLLCELTYGYNSSMYHEGVQCMVDNHCMDAAKNASSDGTCLATSEEAIKNLTDMEQVKGRWWILKGLNCGQDGWPAGFDYFPCQYDDFVPGVTGDDMWIDHIGYCGGTNNSCITPMLRTVANVSITQPGVLKHWYTDPALKPQTEEWRVLSFPHPDWMLYIYCGSTPMGPYAGGSIVSRTHTHISAIPDWVENIFKQTARRYDFDLDSMCVSDTSRCEDPFGPHPSLVI